jgi:uncharacterized protein with PQ loop repeat
MNLVLDGMVLCATVLGSGMAFPQARKIVRTGRVEGVSAAWAGVSAALNSWWLVYGISEGVWAVVPVSALSLALYVTIVALIVRHVGRRGLSAIGGAAVALGALPLPFLVAGGWELAGTVVGLCYGLQLLPAVVEAFRWSDLAGVAVGTWVIAVIEAGIWLVYGLAVADPALIAGGASGVAMSALILARIVAVETRHRAIRVASAM